MTLMSVSQFPGSSFKLPIKGVNMNAAFVWDGRWPLRHACHVTSLHAQDQTEASVITDKQKYHQYGPKASQDW